MTQKYLRVNEVAKFLSVSRATIYRWIHSNSNFPKPIKLGERSTVFDFDEVKTFVEDRRDLMTVA